MRQAFQSCKPRREDEMKKQYVLLLLLGMGSLSGMGIFGNKKKELCERASTGTVPRPIGGKVRSAEIRKRQSNHGSDVVLPRSTSGGADGGKTGRRLSTAFPSPDVPLSKSPASTGIAAIPDERRAKRKSSNLSKSPPSIVPEGVGSAVSSTSSSPPDGYLTQCIKRMDPEMLRQLKDGVDPPPVIERPRSVSIASTEEDADVLQDQFEQRVQLLNNSDLSALYYKWQLALSRSRKRSSSHPEMSPLIIQTIKEIYERLKNVESDKKPQESQGMEVGFQPGGLPPSGVVKDAMERLLQLAQGASGDNGRLSSPTSSTS